MQHWSTEQYIYAYVIATSALFTAFAIFKAVSSVLKKEKPKPKEAAEVRKIYKQLDSTKRKSLQPGPRSLPDGWTEFEIDQIVKDKPRSKPPLSKDSAVKKRKPHTPGVKPFNKEQAIENAKNVNHIFYGSQLAVGDLQVVTGLSRSKHMLEINNSNQLFIDNNQLKINHDTVMRIKRELVKMQNPQLG